MSSGWLVGVIGRGRGRRGAHLSSCSSETSSWPRSSMVAGKAAPWTLNPASLLATSSTALSWLSCCHLRHAAWVGSWRASMQAASSLCVVPGQQPQQSPAIHLRHAGRAASSAAAALRQSVAPVQQAVRRRPRIISTSFSILLLRARCERQQRGRRDHLR